MRPRARAIDDSRPPAKGIWKAPEIPRGTLLDSGIRFRNVLGAGRQHHHDREARPRGRAEDRADAREGRKDQANRTMRPQIRGASLGCG
jgi:hypothetical protein